MLLIYRLHPHPTHPHFGWLAGGRIIKAVDDLLKDASFREILLPVHDGFVDIIWKDTLGDMSTSQVI